MQECTPAYICWLTDHPIVFGILIVVLVVISIFWSVPYFIKYRIKEPIEREKRIQEMYREYKVIRHKARANILKAEEWNVDTTRAKQSLHNMDMKVMILKDQQKHIAMLPIGVAISYIVGFLTYFSPQNWKGLEGDALLVFLILWSGYHIVRIHLCSQAIKRIKREEALATN